MADPTPNAPANVPNYLVQSILATIFCCPPFGIVAIIFAAQVNGKLATGDLAGATQSSKQAKMWCWISFGVGLVCYVLPIVLWIIGVVIAISQGPNAGPHSF
jgi:hypothetical protein